MISATVLSWTVVSVCAEVAGAQPDAALSTWRAERRAALRASAADKSGDAFRLLVVPVDFADRRLPSGWNAADALAPRLAGLDGESLERYFSATSGTPGWLRIVLSPLVSWITSMQPHRLPKAAAVFAGMTHARRGASRA